MDQIATLAPPLAAADLEELQRLFTCMTGSSGPTSLAQGAVLGMELDLFCKGWPVGLSLGPLPDVRKRFGLGRPASQAAIKILEARGLLDVRRGPGGGVFVAAPAQEDVAGAVLMHLAFTEGTLACIEEFRLIVWRMVVTAAIHRRTQLPPSGNRSSPGGFAVELADHAGCRTMGVLARLAETLVQIAQIGRPQGRDRVLDAAIRQGDLGGALKRLDVMAGPAPRNAPRISLEVAERGFSLSGRKSAMALAAQMARELSVRAASQEAEWETGDRLGYTDAVVRQARRILQDFGIVRCRQGSKGAQLAPTAPPTGVIRLLASCLVVHAAQSADRLEAISFLVSSAPALAARRMQADDGARTALIARSATGETFDPLTLENMLMELSGNPLLVIVVRSVWLTNLFFTSDPVVPPNVGDMVAINLRILRAIEAGDADVADALAWAKLDMMRRSANPNREAA